MSEKKAMSKAFRVVTRAVDVMMKRVYNEIPIQQIYLFLRVAEQEGITMDELKKTSDIAQSCVSKNIRQLRTWLKSFDESARSQLVAADKVIVKDKVLTGHGLLRTEQDLYNPRTRVFGLQTKARRSLRLLLTYAVT